MQIEALVVLGIIGAILGLLLGIADKYLQVQEDGRIVKVTEMLPMFNCGACGYPGCNGFANAIVSGEVEILSLCKPIKSAAKMEIKEYLQHTPGPDGKIINVEI
mgnify:FL=1